MNPQEENKQNNQSKKVVHPLPGQTGREEMSPAVELIRQKVDALFAKEPNVKQELAVIRPDSKPTATENKLEPAKQHRSKHQQFMYELSKSGKSLAEIQTEWHNYYVTLPDDQKHEVWKEFYDQAARQRAEPLAHKPKLPAQPAKKQRAAKSPKKLAKPHPTDRRTVADVKRQITSKVQSRQLSTKSHLKSVAFGLGMGVTAIAIMMFGLFNERFIAPLIQPSRTVSDTPVIVDPQGAAVSGEPRIIIPKINVDIPVVYDEPSIAEDAIQKALERGVVHYATTPDPGELGNGVIFGHSSNNILNPGQYKFAFVLLSRLQNGDTFMLEHKGERYVYRVYEKKVVAPSDLGVLGNTGKQSTFTLITCDPPGTVRNRLVVIGEQISPNPSGNVAANIEPNVASQAEPAELPSAAPSLWSRLIGWLSS